MKITGLPHPKLLVFLAVVAAGALAHRAKHESVPADGVWASPSPVAHTASVPLFEHASDLAFALSEAQTVAVDVYDASGGCVRRFPASTFPPGDHSISWDGRDDHGREVSAGFYLARFDFGGAWSVRRLLWIGGMP